MAKTRSQESHVQIKKEECEDKPKLNQLLHRTKNVTKNRSKITKKEKTAKTEPRQAQMTKVKTENTDDNKVILSLPMKTLRRSKVTKEQIAELIGYTVNDKMTVKAASEKAKMSYPTALKYHQAYKNNPEHKIPLPKMNLFNSLSRITQKKIQYLIYYIIHDKMSITQAAIIAKMDKRASVKYYKQYLEDPDHKIPTLNTRTTYSYRRCTQEQINDLISYIVNSNMSVTAAAKKVYMDKSIAGVYYSKYLEDPNHEIPLAGTYNINGRKRFTNDQIKSLIACIVDDGIDLSKAALKASMNVRTARKYYQQYLNDPNHSIPTPETNKRYSSQKHYTLDQIKIFFSCIIIDKSNVKQASLKANISEYLGQKYYTRYLKNLTNTAKSTTMFYSVEKMEKVVEYIQKDKMTIKSAAIKANLGYETALKHYRRYLKDPQLGIPKVKLKQYTQEDIKRLIGYIVHDKMSISSAAGRIKMTNTTAYKYYKAYQNDPEHKIPVPIGSGYTTRCKTFDKYSQIIENIYKTNPSIKSIHENHHSNSNIPDINIKLESVEEDTKMIIRNENN